MEYRIENGQVIATLNRAEVEEILNGFEWSDSEGQVVNGPEWDEMTVKFKDALKEL